MGSYQVVPVACSRRRAVAFLESDNDPSCDARQAFEKLNEKKQDEVRSRFKHWTDGFPYDRYYHGWPNQPEYKECFVFKYKEKERNHRLYGFLFHPRQQDRAFQMCVLSSHAVKPSWETDPRELNAMNALRVDVRVVAAITMTFGSAETQTCLN